MKKYLFSLLLAMIADVSVLWAESVQIGDLYYNLDDATKTAEVTYQTNEFGNNYDGLTTANIPTTVVNNGETYRVITIGDQTFYSCNSLISITIPNSVTNIGRNAFRYCSSLISVTIPNSVTEMGDGCFSLCTNLQDVKLSANLTGSIGESCFESCSNLTAIEIPNKVDSVKDEAFFKCMKLERVTMGESVTYIGRKTFYNCPIKNLTWNAINCETLITDNEWSMSKLETITFGDKVEYIPAHLCASAKITSVILPYSLKKIGNNVFSYCYDFNIICYASTVPEIGAQNNMSNILYVPQNLISEYARTEYWNYCNEILPINVSTVQTDMVQITSTTTSAEIIWPQVENAEEYEISVKDASNNEVCNILFNADGQLQSIIYRAPTRNRLQQQESEDESLGFSFIVTGLDSGKKYAYNITAQDNEGSAIKIYSGSFTTQADTTTDIGFVAEQDSYLQSQKILGEDGQVYIFTPEGKKYTLQGAEMK